MTKFIFLPLFYWLIEKTDAFYWLKSDRLTFQIFCSRSLHQYHINYKFHVSVRLLTIKISQWAHEDSALIVKKSLCRLWLFFWQVFLGAWYSSQLPGKISQSAKRAFQFYKISSCLTCSGMEVLRVCLMARSTLLRSEVFYFGNWLIQLSSSNIFASKSPYSHPT